MAGFAFESKQTENTPVTRIESGAFSVRFAYSLSYERITGNRPSNDYLEWNASGSTLVFALCDGVETSHAGGLAARFLGHRLVEWLGNLPAEAEDDLAQMKTQLDAALAEWMPAAQRAVRSRAKASEAVFTCGRVSATPEGLRGFMAGVGLIYVRLYDRKGRDIGFTPLRHAYDRWSTLRGLRGQIFIEPLGPRPPLQRMTLFTDGLSELEEKLAGLSEVELQSAILDSFQSVLNDDISLLDVQICDQPVNGKPKKVVIGASELPTVRLERVDDSLEWELRDDTVYSILQLRDSSGERVVGAGNFFSWRPPVDRDCAYRVCLVSVAGRAYSSWLDWQPVSTEDMWDEEPPETGTDLPLESGEPQAGFEPEKLEEPVEDKMVATEPVTGLEEAPAVELPDSPQSDPETMIDIMPTAAVETVEKTDEPPVPPPAPVDLAEAPPAVSDIPDRKLVEVPDAERLPPGATEAQPPVPEPAPVEPEMIDNTSPAEIIPIAASPDAGEEPPPAEIIHTSGQPESGLFKWLGKLPDITGMLRRAAGIIGAKRPAASGESRTLPSGPWVEKGKYPGQYILHWQASPGANEYEVWDQPLESSDAGTFLRTSDNRLRLENLSTGVHRLHIRPVGLAFDVDWQAWPHSDLNVPVRIQAAPGNLRVESNLDEAEIRLRWAAISGEIVEEYWVFEVGREEHRLIGKVGGDITRFSVRKMPADRARRFVVRAVNWSGLGPVSETVVYQPGMAPASQNRITGRGERARQGSGPVAPAKPVEQRIAQVPELCEAVNRWVRSQGLQMSSMKLEQRYENADQYLMLENRRLGQLITLPLIKGPEYRLTVYGTRGEVAIVEIHFEKRNWIFLVKFLPVLRRGG